ncbi:MAG TPA: hypothetical protein VHG91_13555 [Longimicrobium sp.]|nr:hypothetical protein [Longimicrobium sp.]
MKKLTFGLAAVATLALTGTAQAQICAGFPTIDRGFSFGASVQLPEGADFGDVYGVDASYNASGPLALFGGLTVAEGGAEDLEIYEVGLALETPSIGLMIGPSVSACPQVSVQFADEAGGSTINVPVGFGIGANLTQGTGLAIMPYVIPQVVFARFNADDDFPLLEDESDTFFGIEGGVLVGMGMFFFGGTIDHVFEDGADPVFGIRAGIRI